MVSATSDIAAKIILLNPIAQVIQDVRYCLITPETITSWNYMDNIFLQLIPFIIVVVFLVWGSWYFRKKSKRFAEEI